MKMRTARVDLPVLRRLMLTLLALVVVACQKEVPRADWIGGGDLPITGPKAKGCDTPNAGCACDIVGERVQCGQVEIRSEDHVSCSMGMRECQYDGIWGECVGDHVTTQSIPTSSLRTQAITGPIDCVGNPCDPYCQQTTNDGQNLGTLPTGVCAVPGGGIAACGKYCGYSGPHALSYEALPAAWKKRPTSCTAASDSCGYDGDCSPAGSCTDWTFPCYDPNPPGCALTKKLDLELGPPCAATGPVYHFQVCNRGADRADAGTIKIGIYSSSAKLGTAVTSTSPGAPDKGTVTFTLGTTVGKYIDPGQCLDVNPSNSTSASVDLTGTRAVALNYDASVAECNFANNWHVFDPGLACTGCVGLECNQVCPSANLTGTIYDPGGVNVVPGVIVYVPNGLVLPLADGVQCDSCANLYSGNPIASAVTGANGTFTLANVPVGVDFPLVIQIGRWRRQVTIKAISGTCGSGTPTAVLPSGESSRLPSNQNEGNIPKIALSMSAGDHLECLLRRIGIDDSEFTPPSGNGRVHLYAYNGLTLYNSATKRNDLVSCAATPNGTCANDLWSSPAQLDKYNAVIAPCDKNSFGGSPTASNPYTDYNNATLTNPLNTSYPPFQTMPDSKNANAKPPSVTEQNNLKAYVDKGGRLFSTHWMAYFMTAKTYPSAVNYVFGTYVDADRQDPVFPYTVDQSSTLGKSLADWMGKSTVTFTNWRHLAASVNSPAIRLAYGDSTQAPVSHAAGSTKWGGPMVSAFQFDAPWAVPSPSQCGRVVVAESHVSSLDPALSTAGTDQQTLFPDSCLPRPDLINKKYLMTDEEKSFEFLLFSATQCVGLVVPPSPIPPLAPATYSVDYQASCPSGTKPEWQFFSWKASVPATTSLAFKAASAATKAELDTALSVAVGTATANATIWTSDAKTVDWHLRNDASPTQASRDWLRVFITINPSGSTTPQLTQWQQTFDCKPAE